MGLKYSLLCNLDSTSSLWSRLTSSADRRHREVIRRSYDDARAYKTVGPQFDDDVTRVAKVADLMAKADSDVGEWRLASETTSENVKAPCGVGSNTEESEAGKVEGSVESGSAFADVVGCERNVELFETPRRGSPREYHIAASYDAASSQSARKDDSVNAAGAESKPHAPSSGAATRKRGVEKWNALACRLQRMSVSK